MYSKCWRLFLLLIWLSPSGFCATRFVNASNAAPASLYLTWATAATTIQSAINAANAGDLILVTNGLYRTGGRVVAGQMSNRVAITKAVTVQSVNGPGVTVIQGVQIPGTTNGIGATRCVYVANNATLSGFTLTNGATRNGGDQATEQSGGGVWCASTSATISNCVITGNSAYFAAGGAYSGTLKNCVLIGNVASDGGGVFNSVLLNSILSSNTATFGGGAWSGSLMNCLVSSNSSFFVGGGTDGSNLTNCTVVGNWSGNWSGGVNGGVMYNCILYYNMAPNDSNYTSAVQYYCCAIPEAFGAGNFIEDPMFVDLVGGNFHLQSNSPCINSGRNWGAGLGPDLDGNARIVGGTVDMGAYEFQSPQSLISYGWMQRYGLPTDGSADFQDSDSDGMNNWQEWIAGTDPADRVSNLAMLGPIVNVSNTVVRWRSVEGRTYLVQRSTNLAAQPAFVTVVTNVIGETGTTTFTDGQANRRGPCFYRFGVQP